MPISPDIFERPLTENDLGTPIHSYALEAKKDAAKSFGGKAQVIEYDTGAKALKSYDTIVCAYLPDKTFIPPRFFYSATTLRHQKEFIHQHAPSENQALADIECLYFSHTHDSKKNLSADMARAKAISAAKPKHLRRDNTIKR